MAIIELNLEKPALKRVESVDEKGVEEEQIATEDATEMVETETEDVEVEETDSSGGSRLKRLAILGGTAAGVAAARKLRQRRKSKGEQQELEEDWQTAE